MRYFQHAHDAQLSGSWQKTLLLFVMIVLGGGILVYLHYRPEPELEQQQIQQVQQVVH